MHLADGSSFHPVQVVVPASLPNYAGEVLHLTAGCAVEATGSIVPSPAKGQPFEMQAQSVRVLGWVDDPDSYPIQPKPHTLEFLREVAHLRPRTNVIGAATRVRHTLAQAIHRFFHEHGSSGEHPYITASLRRAQSRCSRAHARSRAPIRARRREDHFRRILRTETFLTVSWRLNVECYCLALRRSTLRPTFRAGIRTPASTSLSSG